MTPTEWYAHFSARLNRLIPRTPQNEPVLRAVAAELGLRRESLNKWYTGESQPDSHQVMVLCRHFPDVTPNDLIFVRSQCPELEQRLRDRFPMLNAHFAFVGIGCASPDGILASLAELSIPPFAMYKLQEKGTISDCLNILIDKDGTDTPNEGFAPNIPRASLGYVREKMTLRGRSLIGVALESNKAEALRAHLIGGLLTGAILGSGLAEAVLDLT